MATFAVRCLRREQLDEECNWKYIEVARILDLRSNSATALVERINHEFLDSIGIVMERLWFIVIGRIPAVDSVVSFCEDPATRHAAPLLVSHE